MLQSTATLQTQHASKYLQQLCKHFAHKIDVDYSATHGKCALPPGPAILTADDQRLNVCVSAKDEDGLKTAKHIIDSHIVKFAFREKIDGLAWDERQSAG